MATLPEPKSIKEACNDCIIVLDVRQLEDRERLKEANSIKYIYSDVVPVIWLSDAKRTWSVSDKQLSYPIIETSFPINEGSHIELEVVAQFETEFESENVLGFVPGTEKADSFVVFTAHYDHLGMMGTEACFYGANDNASGTAFLLSIAEHYVTNPAEYTCVFIAFAAEEAGLKGSEYFVGHPVIDLEKIRFLINLDLMGSGKEGITVVNAKENPKEFDIMQGINEELDLLPVIRSRGQAANSDHYYFAEAGVPAIFIYALGGSQAYHDIYDVYANLTFEEYSDIFKLLTHLVEKL
jgi:Iap family predicted aminopeptidase